MLLPVADRDAAVVAVFTDLAYVAQLSATAPAAVPLETDYGSDLSCVTDIAAMATELSGDDPRIVAESDARRLQTDRGTLIDNPNYGWNLQDLVQKPLTASDIATIPGQVKGELLKDDRHETLDVWTTGQNTSNLLVHVKGTTAKGPFGFTMAVTDAGVAVKEIYG